MDQLRVFRATAIRICALVCALWLLLLSLLTVAVAKDFQQQIRTRLPDIKANYAADSASQEPEVLPGQYMVERTRHLGEAYRWMFLDPLFPFVLPQMPSSYSSDDWFWDKWDLLYGFDCAVAFWDGEGNILMESGSYMTLSYVTEAQWRAQNTEIAGYAYLDLDALSPGSEALKSWVWDIPSGSSVNRFHPGIIRVTGYFDGDELIPTALDQGWADVPLAEDEAAELCRLDRGGGLHWKNVLTQEAPADTQLVTVYSWEQGGILHQSQPIRMFGRDYDSLVALLRDKEVYHTRLQEESLWQSKYILVCNGPYKTGADTMRLVVRCFPMEYALLRLIPLYLFGSLAVAVALWLLLRSLRKAAIKQARSMQEGLHSLQIENQQLATALDYAHNAEENRRQLVSNITHELKTPLAVIHSYAEGLQSGIAREKQDKYLQVILEESEKMDAMVLEMLDLSRLEAGKVKLSTDRFSLLALTQEILEKLAPTGSRKQRIYFDYCDACILTADESRIRQVVTNLLSNALRYTPEGGGIWIRVCSNKEGAHFQIQNTAAHLDEEVLQKIFETFYRADSARTEKGTGLGLPIARSIIELHRGTLTAKNTWVNTAACLDFSFHIPQG